MVLSETMGPIERRSKIFQFSRKWDPGTYFRSNTKRNITAILYQRHGVIAMLYVSWFCVYFLVRHYSVWSSALDDKSAGIKALWGVTTHLPDTPSRQVIDRATFMLSQERHPNVVLIPLTNATQICWILVLRVVIKSHSLECEASFTGVLAHFKWW